MTRTIWKYPLSLSDDSLEMPAGATLLAVQMQDGEACLWALVDITAPRVARRLAIYGTGWDLPAPGDDGGVYVGTLQMAGGAVVLHLFDRGEVAS